MRDLVSYLLIVFIVLGIVYVLQQTERDKGYSYAEIRQLFEQEKVESFVVKSGKTLVLTLRDPVDGSYQISYDLYSFDFFYDDLHELVEQQKAAGILLDYDYQPGLEAPGWVAYLPYVLLVIGLVLLWNLLSQRSAAGDGGADRTARFGKARVKRVADEGRKVTFADVAGADEEKAELLEIVDFLKDPKKFLALGARIPKGLLLVGPPGTGKTLLARACAGEAGVEFLSISGSDFVELYVGVGASRVRDLFDQAKKAGSAIIFIDEIDAVGRQRGAGLGGGHDEREQTLNQLLVEMDGFGTNEGVVVMAATNRPDILDPALLRPGRFDRQVYVGMPDIKGREAILRVHAKGKPLAEDVILADLARATGGFSGADLENLINEAALLAARRNKRFIGMDECRESMLKVLAGPEKKSRKVSDRERRLTAYHEAGHAVVIRNLKTHDPVTQISIVPRSRSGGMTVFLPTEDKNFVSRTEMFEQIVAGLGGRVAEQLVLGDISTGGSDDIRRATAVARNMVVRYGMSDRLGPVAFDSGHDEVFIGRSITQTRTYSEEVASLIDKEIKTIIDKAYGRAEDLLRRNMDKVRIVAEYLLENETMDKDAFNAVFEERNYRLEDYIKKD
ncbi:MAG TPA: ATP-dependent zinc metalloprotease FtsH [Oscillospiraceae bacterium]|nr:ATP-dependent zinc metalloprotease FtsH [Oscillospiraceae bacterium]